MTAPDDARQLDIAEVAAVMNGDPLSKAPFELAQFKVIAQKLTAQNQILVDRVQGLERHRDPEQK